MEKEIKRIIVSSTSGLKETILSIPSFFLVKKMYPDAELILVTKKESYDIVRHLTHIDRFFVLDDYKKTEVEGKIAYFGADVFLALYSDVLVEKLAKASKAKIKIGPITGISSFFTYMKGSVQKRKKSLKNEIYYHLDLVKKLNKKLYNDNFEINANIYFSSASKIAAETFFKESGITGKILVVSPFDNIKEKKLSDEDYVSLIKRFKEKNGTVRVIIVCSIDQEERVHKMTENINMNGVYPFPNGGDLLNTAAIINKTNVYLGSISGITHIAGALNKQIIAICSKKEELVLNRWGLPKNEKVAYIISNEKNNRKTEDEILIELEKAFKYYNK